MRPSWPRSSGSDLAEADELLPGMFEPVREHLARELGEA